MRYLLILYLLTFMTMAGGSPSRESTHQYSLDTPVEFNTLDKAIRCEACHRKGPERSQEREQYVPGGWIAAGK